MNTTQPYDFIAIGIGPFNLGLAALSEPVKGLNGLFIDQSAEFNWHPGLMLDSATLQVPFMADLVTMADPTSKFSFLNFLKETDRLYKFFIREDFFILRKEYNAYCIWVSKQLSNLQWNSKVTAVEYLEELKIYAVSIKNAVNAETSRYFTKRLVLGTGTQAYLPEFAKKEGLSNVIHTGDYLHHKPNMKDSDSVAVIGSGQSAAEVFYDLLPDAKNGRKLSWFTRPDRFFPMEYSKLTLELTSPEYVDYFYKLPADDRDQLLKNQNPLYKGINYDLINAIHDTLYEMTVGGEEVPVTLRPSSELCDIQPLADGSSEMVFKHVQLDREFTLQADWVILATGYKAGKYPFLKDVEERINRDKSGRYDVARNYSIDVNKSEIFVQNAELHTHGFVTPDLGMGAYRNAYIINEITGEPTYKVEKRIAFQEFGMPVPEVVSL